MDLPACVIREIKAGRLQNAANMARVSVEMISIYREKLFPAVLPSPPEPKTRAPAGWSKFQIGRMYARGLTFERVGELLNVSPYAVEDALRNRGGTTAWFRRRIEQVIDATEPQRFKVAAE